MKLPRNASEFLLFLGIVSILSVNIIAPLITFFETGFTFKNWISTLQVIPFIWIVVVILVLVTRDPASKVTSKILDKSDGFSAHIIVTTIVNVAMMSVILTVVGTWIGTRSFTWEPIIHFFYRWPRNFAISLFIEMIVAQPLARFILFHLHLHNDQRDKFKA
jgi:hypothetical protein